MERMAAAKLACCASASGWRGHTVPGRRRRQGQGEAVPCQPAVAALRGRGNTAVAFMPTRSFATTCRVALAECARADTPTARAIGSAMAGDPGRTAWRAGRPRAGCASRGAGCHTDGSEAVISQRICVQELELNLISYLLFRGSELIGFERSLIGI